MTTTSSAPKRKTREDFTLAELKLIAVSAAIASPTALMNERLAWAIFAAAVVLAYAALLVAQMLVDNRRDSQTP